VVSSHYFDNAANIETARNLIKTLAIGPQGGGGLVSACGGRTRRFIRFAWHDASTTNVEDCTGGLDGSILLESPALGFVSNNPGPIWGQFVTDITYVHNRTCALVGESCKADLIAMAAIEAVQGCGGPYIEFEYGRVDATSTNVNNLTPKETDTLEQAEEKFSRMGIDKHDEILALIGGGHTVARHGLPNPHFPIPPNAPPFFELPEGCVVTSCLPLVGPNGNPLPCSIGFDTTPTKFDSQYFGDVLDYLNGTRCPVSPQNYIVIPVEEEMYEATPYYDRAVKWRTEDAERQAADEEHSLDEENENSDESGTNSPGWIKNSFRDTFRRSFEYLLNWRLSTCTPICNNGNGSGNGNGNCNNGGN